MLTLFDAGRLVCSMFNPNPESILFPMLNPDKLT